MLKKGIWFFLHMLSTVILAVSLLIGVSFCYQYSYSLESIRENGDYEESTALLQDLTNEAVIIWDYFEAKQLVAEHDISEPLDEQDIADLLDMFGLTVDDVTELIGKYGITEEGIAELLKNDVDIPGETKVQDMGRASADISSDDEYATAQSMMLLGESRYDPAYTNLRYTITYEGEYIDSNLPVEEIYHQSLCYVETSPEAGDCELCIYLNADYPVNDYYSQASQIYNRVQDWKWIYLGMAVVSLAVMFVSLIMQTKYAGHVKGAEGICLSWVDKPPLELSLVFWGGMAAAVYTGIVISGKNCYVQRSLFWLIVYGLAVLVGDIMALVGYLSLVRRIKAHTLGSNSICYKVYAAVVRTVKKLLRMTKVSQQILIACGTYIVVMLLLAMIGGRVSMILAVLISIIGLLIVFRDAVSRQEILDGMEKITSGELDYQIDLDKINHLQMEVAKSANQVGSAMKTAIQQSLKDERLKADLITNVSHDIKTPLTSIINYVDLLKREDIQNEKAQGYLEILDQKSQRLKHLTEDLVEASKLSSGNVVLNMERIDFNEILQQALGEFEEKFASKDLIVVLKRPDTRVMVMGEGRRIWRVLENLFQNVYKYAMPGTRVYVELQKNISEMIFTLKNISQYPLNINADELTERFIRGDISRTTEGSGLGLSIARDLTALQQGGFDIHLDGDLFKVTLKFDLINEKE